MLLQFGIDSFGIRFSNSDLHFLVLFYFLDSGVLNAITHDKTTGLLCFSKAFCMRSSSLSGSIGIQMPRREVRLFLVVLIKDTTGESILLFQSLKQVTGR